MEIMKEDIRKVPNACKFCRKLMELPNPPKTLELYRDEMLCLTVDVEKASKLQIDENTLRYRKYRPVDVQRLRSYGASAQGAI